MVERGWRREEEEEEGGKCEEAAGPDPTGLGALLWRCQYSGNGGEGLAGAGEAGGGRTNQLDACALGCSAVPSGFPWHSP